MLATNFSQCSVCTKFCSEKGFEYAGVEYGRECYVSPLSYLNSGLCPIAKPHCSYSAELNSETAAVAQALQVSWSTRMHVSLEELPDEPLLYLAQHPLVPLNVLVIPMKTAVEALHYLYTEILQRHLQP